jgi:nicotinate-nucleotide pyrophosphorylase (carboxylating)
LCNNPVEEAMLFEDRLIRYALEEDVGPGDVTTEGLIASGQLARARIVAKEPLVLAGLALAARVFTLLDPAARFESPSKDGDKAQANDTVATISGELRVLLTGERTALNFLQRLSGIATFTRQFVERTAGTNVRLTDTRKTTPGWRKLEKYAVKMGGAHNHRFGLYDGVLIKDNHIKACGGITETVKRLRSYKGHLLGIEVEVSNLHEVQEALDNQVDVIMLDNMDIGEVKDAVRLIAGRALVEVSGGVELDTVADLAAAGVDIISAGALTHSARAVDLSMDIID